MTSHFSGIRKNFDNLVPVPRIVETLLVSRISMVIAVFEKMRPFARHTVDKQFEQTYDSCPTNLTGQFIFLIFSVLPVLTVKDRGFFTRGSLSPRRFDFR